MWNQIKIPWSWRRKSTFGTLSYCLIQGGWQEGCSFSTLLPVPHKRPCVPLLALLYINTGSCCCSADLMSWGSCLLALRKMRGEGLFWTLNVGRGEVKEGRSSQVVLCFLFSAVGSTFQFWEKRKDPTWYLTLGKIDLTERTGWYSQMGLSHRGLRQDGQSGHGRRGGNPDLGVGRVWDYKHWLFWRYKEVHSTFLLGTQLDDISELFLELDVAMKWSSVQQTVGRSDICLFQVWSPKPPI